MQRNKSSKKLQEAREAYNTRSVENTIRAHSKPKEQYEHEERHQLTSGKYIKDVVFGGLDGIITTFAIVSGVAGACMSSSVILILGLANLVADGFSMAVGNYLGTKSEIECARREREREEYEVEHCPEEEREEIREIYRKKALIGVAGFKGEDLETVVRVITSDRKVWVDTMMVEELGILLDEKSPLIAASITFLSFVAIGSVPLSSYIAAVFYPSVLPSAFEVTIALTALTIFCVGALKSIITGKHWVHSGGEMLAIGGAAAIFAYVIGHLLKEFRFDPS